MPLIQVKLIEGVFDASEKVTIIEKLTDAMVSVEGEAMRPVTWVTIEEVASASGESAASVAHRRHRRRARCGAVLGTPGATAAPGLPSGYEARLARAR